MTKPAAGFPFSGKNNGGAGKRRAVFSEYRRADSSSLWRSREPLPGRRLPHPRKNKNKQSIQSDIGKGAEPVGDHGYLCRPVRPDDIGKYIIKKNDRRAQGDNAQIAAGVGKGSRISAQGQGYGRKKNQDKRQEQEPNNQGTVTAETGIGFDPAVFLFPKSKGNGSTAAAAQKSAQARRMENSGAHREMAAILTGSPVWPIKKVSAML